MKVSKQKLQKIVREETKKILSEQNIRKYEGKKIEFIEYTKDMGKDFLHINFSDGTSLNISGDLTIN
jgi:hypothetical protein